MEELALPRRTRQDVLDSGWRHAVLPGNVRLGGFLRVRALLPCLFVLQEAGNLCEIHALADGDLALFLAQTAGELDGCDGVAAELDKVGVAADLGVAEIQQLSDDATEQRLAVCRRRLDGCVCGR